MATLANGLSGSQGYAWTFDGATDYLSRSDDGTFDPAGDFTVMGVVTPNSVAAGATYIASKYLAAGDQRGWAIYRNGSSLFFSLSTDGTAGGLIANSAGGAFAAGRTTCFVSTFDASGGAGSMSNSIFVDELAASTKSTFAGVPFDSSADFNIGSVGSSSIWHGGIHFLAYWRGVATEAEARHLCRRWRGSVSAAGVPLTISSASPPAILIAPPDSGTEPFLVQMPADTMQVGKSTSTDAIGGVGISGISNLVNRGCFISGSTGWSTSVVGGATVTADTTAKAYGLQSIKFSHAGAGDQSQADSGCKTTGIGADLMVQLWAEDGGDTSSCAAQILEYDDAVCGPGGGGLLATNSMIAPGTDIATGWTRYDALLAAGTWNAATSSWYLSLNCADTGGAYSVNWGVAQASARSIPTDGVCCTDADSTAVCTDLLPTADGQIPANGDVTVAGTFSTPYAGADLAAISVLWTDGDDGGANTMRLSLSASTDEPTHFVYDATATSKYNAPNTDNWAANTEYSVMTAKDSEGNIKIEWPAGTWVTTAVGAGAGTRTAAQGALHLCSTQAAGSDCRFGKILVTKGVAP